MICGVTLWVATWVANRLERCAALHRAVNDPLGGVLPEPPQPYLDQVMSDKEWEYITAYANGAVR